MGMLCSGPKAVPFESAYLQNELNETKMKRLVGLSPQNKGVSRAGGIVLNSHQNPPEGGLLVLALQGVKRVTSSARSNHARTRLPRAGLTQSQLLPNFAFCSCKRLQYAGNKVFFFKKINQPKAFAPPDVYPAALMASGTTRHLFKAALFCVSKAKSCKL